MKSISIKFLFGGALAIIAVLVVLLGGAVHRLEKASEAVTHANEARYSSYLLADELRQSSDDLTRLVRTYTVTGDPKWAAQYQEVLDIRAPTATKKFIGIFARPIWLPAKVLAPQSPWPI